MKKIFLLLGVICLVSAQQDEHVWEGNLALKASQQPNPFFAFGQNVNDKGDNIGIFFVDWINGCKKNFVEVVPSFIYQPSKNFSVYTVLPIVTSTIDNCNYVGLEDIFIQGEYAFFTKSSPEHFLQSTIVANITLPTGNGRENPPMGYGSPSFFIGATTEYVTAPWYVFYSLGALFTTSHTQGTKFGNNFFYQTGICKNLAYSPRQWLLSAMVEFFGIYTEKNKMCGITDANSGGNIFYIGPSLWYARQQFVIQLAAAFPVAQQLNGIQRKNRFWLGMEMRWKFNT